MQEEPFLKKWVNAGGKMFGSLQEAYDRLEAIVNSSHDGIYITDGEANTQWVNPAYLNISGLKEEDVLGRNMWDLERQGIISRSGTLIALRTRKPVTLEQTFLTGKRALITSTPSFEENGEIVMVVTNVRDVTDYYQLQEKYQNVKEKYRWELEYSRKLLKLDSEMIAEDEHTLAALTQANRVAAKDATVLLTGETGVGKECFARYIYKNSSRKEERFITVNCGAIPASLIESELFGYEKGAFTGASQSKPGVFELADGGTIFLDEIGELPLEMQVKLLRVLQERKLQRLGGHKDISLDIRIIAATNRDLGQMVEEGKFRKDLYYRLNVVPIEIPPLRDRREDIQPLADSFLQEYNRKYHLQKRFSQGAMSIMKEYDWPGNVRELKNIVERMVILSRDEMIWESELPFSAGWREQKGESPSLDTSVNLKRELAGIELKYMESAYEKFGNVRDAAKSLSMDASTFVRRRQRCEKMLHEKERNTEN